MERPLYNLLNATLKYIASLNVNGEVKIYKR
jgi:hypothetical protein